jgi:hypothetical protein
MNNQYSDVTRERSCCGKKRYRSYWQADAVIEQMEDESLHSYWCRHEPFGRIPFLVEAWAGTFEPRSHDADDVYDVSVIGATINRTPALLRAAVYREGRSRKATFGIGRIRP